MDELPALAVPDVLAWCGERSLQLGRQYARDGAVVRQRRLGLMLKARCQGTAPQPYAVEVTLDAKGIASARCSCPVGAGGRCKHAAAVLLSWLEIPEEFVESETLAQSLERLNKVELIALLRELARSSPALEERIELHIGMVRTVRAGEPVDTRALRRQIQLAMEGLGSGVARRYGYDAAYEMGEDDEENPDAIEFVGDGFLPFFERARRYADGGDLSSAVEVYVTLATTVMQEYSPEEDYEGELMAEANAIIDESVEKLGYVLESTLEAVQREVTLHALFAIYDEGRTSDAGESEHVEQVMLAGATPDERRLVAQWVRNITPAARGAVEDYRRRMMGRFLLELEADTLDDEAYLRMCREAGLTEMLVARLLERGRVLEACAAVAGVEHPYQFLPLVEQVLAAGHAVEAEELVRLRANKTKEPGLLRWLMERASVAGQWEDALELAEKLFWQAPSVRGYEEVKALAEHGGRWEPLRSGILAHLERDRHFALLVELRLLAGEPDMALSAFKQLREAGSVGYGGWGYRGWDLRVKVAAAVEATRPDEAIALYREEAEKLIAAQGRENYAQAATHLQRVRDLYRRQGREQEWEELIVGLREQNRRLRALKEELAKAGL